MDDSVSLDRSTRQGRRNYDILKKTLVGEAAAEEEEGKQAICWVIYNRVKGNKRYWYDEHVGNNIAGVCLKEKQFECWNEGDKREELEANLNTDWGIRVMAEIDGWLPSVFQGRNPIGDCDHCNNPAKEDRPGWLDNVDWRCEIGDHHFYRTKPEFR